MERGEHKVAVAGSLVDIERLDRMTTIVERVHRIFGENDARALWRALGLPNLWPVASAPAERSTRTNMQAARRAVGDFLEQDCERLAEAETHAFALHSAYQQWALKLGRPVLSPPMLGKILPMFGLTRRKGRGATYGGVRLRPRAATRRKPTRA